MRDSIQIVRLFGDVLRVRARCVARHRDLLRPPDRHPDPAARRCRDSWRRAARSRGSSRTRNQLGLLAIIGAISFATEHRTRSVPRLTSISSLVLAGALHRVHPVTGRARHGARGRGRRGRAVRTPPGARRPPPALAAHRARARRRRGAILAWLQRTVDRRDLQRDRRTHLPARALEQDLRPGAPEPPAGLGLDRPLAHRDRPVLDPDHLDRPSRAVRAQRLPRRLVPARTHRPGDLRRDAGAGLRALLAARGPAAQRRLRVAGARAGRADHRSRSPRARCCPSSAGSRS